MSEKIGFSERVWAELRDNFPEGGCATDVAKAIGSDTTSVSQALVAMTNRGAVTRLPNTDELGRMLFVANPDARFRRPRADKEAPAKRKPGRPKGSKNEKRAPRTAVTTAVAAPVAAEQKPRFAIDDSYSIAITTGANGVILDKAAALKLLDFLGSMEPLLSAEE